MCTQRKLFGFELEACKTPVPELQSCSSLMVGAASFPSPWEECWAGVVPKPLLRGGLALLGRVDPSLRVPTD